MSKAQYDYLSPNNQQVNKLYRASPTSSNGSISLPTMRSLGPLQQQQQQHIGSPLPHPPVAQISGPYYRNQGQTLPYPSQYPDVTSDLTGQDIRYVRRVTDSRAMSAGRHDKEVKRRVKTGCLTCRKRRVKMEVGVRFDRTFSPCPSESTQCVEQHPTCRNCQKSKRKCLGYDPIFKAQPGLAAIQSSPSSAHSQGPLVATANPYGSQPHMFGAAHGALTVGYDPALSESVSSPVSASQPFDYTSTIDPALESASAPTTGTASNQYTQSQPAKRPINNLLAPGGATLSHPSLETTWVAISDDTVSGGYKYKQITEAGGIRLIVLQPAVDTSAMIQCSLVHTTVPLSRIGNDLDHYTALSYVWGSPEKSRTIYVDGTPLNITESLYLALHDLRDETRTLQLWADGICINQSDNEEKGIQIRLMGRIYAMAQHTIIYLGPADGNSPEILSLVAIQEGLTQSAGIQESILSKDWFTRVWVFQELVFSTDPWIQCGKLKVKWDIFYNALRKPPTETYKTISKMNRAWMIYHNQIKPDLYNGPEADCSYDSFINESPKNAILELLQASRGKGVSDPRDMVFAHVGFATDIARDDFSIDYSQTCVQVYKNCACYIAGKHGISILFACIGEGGTSTAGPMDLPSWVPDWTMPVARPFPRIATRPVGPVLYPIWVQEEEILVFHLRDIDTVLSVSSELSVHQIPIETRQRIFSRVKKLDNIFNPSQKYDIFKELWYEVYQIWKQIVQDDAILPVELQELEPMHRYHFEKEQDNPFNSYTAVQLLLILVFGTSTDAQCVNGRALARTASGKLALVPASTQKADIVAPIWIESDDFSHARKYVFHPTADISSKAALNDEIVKCMDLQLLDLGPYVETPEEYGIISGKGWSIVHAEFVGECFLDRQESLVASESHNPMENFIVALH